MSYVSHVRKRDGRVVPFESARLVRSIENAARACGYTQFYAQEMADAVMTHLSSCSADAPPSTHDVASAVETVLSATRYRDVMSYYVAYREQRERHRAHCTVVKSQQPSLLDADESLFVMHAGGTRTTPWDRTRLVHALQREASLPRVAAETIARAVEEKIMSSDISRVTTTLLRALTDNELLERGYSAALRQQSSVTIPFSDITHLIDDSTQDIARDIGGNVLQQYVLSHVYSEDVVTAHQRGMLHLSGVRYPGSLHSERHPLCVPEMTARARRAHWRSLCEMQRIGACRAVHIALDETEENITHCSEFIDYVSSHVRGAFVCECPSSLVDKYADVFAACTPTDAVACVSVGCDLSLEPLARLARAGWRVGWMPTAYPSRVIQRISVNMPQAVYRARQADLDSVIEEVYRSCEMAARACRQYATYLRERNSITEAQPIACIECVGVFEAVSILTGSGVFEPTEGMPCARVLMNVISHTLQQLSSTTGVTLALTCGEEDVCGKRFSVIDQSLFPEIFGYLPLGAENLEEIIPAYSRLERHATEDVLPTTCASQAAAITKFFYTGMLPCRMYALSNERLEECMTAFHAHGVPFRIDELSFTTDADEADVSAHELPGFWREDYEEKNT